LSFGISASLPRTLAPRDAKIPTGKYIKEEIVTEPTREELMARIAELESATGAKRHGKLEFRVSEKGGVSVYGLGRFPVTLYYEQWVRLLESVDALRAFIEENKSRLKMKTAQ
jgi:hypothetical protein